MADTVSTFDEEGVPGIAVADTERTAPVAPVSNYSEPHGFLTVPQHFIQLPCCAFTFKSCDGLRSCGSKGSCVCACYKQEGMCCRFIDDPTNCFLCCSGTYEIMRPRVCMKGHQQCFCLEYFCSIPFEDSGYVALADALYAVSERVDGSNEQNDAILACGDCCSLTSCFLNWPTCLGCFCNQFCFCCLHKSMTTKPMCCVDRKKREDLWCVFWRGNCSCVKPSARCRNICQVCCVDERCGCPYDDDIPCTCATCCLVHQVSWQEVPPGMGCCLRLNDAVRNSKSGVYAKGRKFGYNNTGAGVGPGVMARSAVAPAPRGGATNTVLVSGASAASPVSKSSKGVHSQKGVAFTPAPVSPSAAVGSVRVVPVVPYLTTQAQQIQQSQVQQVQVQSYVSPSAAASVFDNAPEEMEVESLE